jgi:ribokinase
MGRVIVVGSVNVDLVVRGERLPAPGETVVGGTFQRFHGGKGGNQAVAAARLGAEVAFVGAVGGDDLGASALEALRAAGVDVTNVARLDDSSTGVALILVDQAGENLISVASGANVRLTEAHVTAAFGRLRPGRGDVVLAGHEIPTATMRAALATGRAAGVRTLLNPAPVGALATADLMDAGVVTPNAGELRQLTGESEPERGARALLSGGLREAVLVSLGATGALLVTADGSAARIPAPAVVAVDATGAGDTLNGALAAGLAMGATVGDAARRAVVAASLSVTRAGAREGMPALADVEHAMATAG